MSGSSGIGFQLTAWRMSSRFSKFFFSQHRTRRVAWVHVNHNIAAFIRRRPGLGFRLFAEHAAVIAGLKLRIAIEVSERAEIADGALPFAGLLSLFDHADDINDGGDQCPVASADAIEPLNENSQVAAAD